LKNVNFPDEYYHILIINHLNIYLGLVNAVQISHLRR
jgi:hypothetical protein